VVHCLRLLGALTARETIIDYDFRSG